MKGYDMRYSLFIVVLAGAMITAGCVNPNNDTPPVTKTITSYVIPVPTILSIQLGQGAISSDQHVRVLSYKELERYESRESVRVLIKPDSNHRLLSFLVEVYNTGTYNIDVSDTHFTMSDSEGNQYYSLSAANPYLGRWSETILPDRKVVRNVFFYIPKSARESSIYYDFGPGPEGQKIISWKLS